MSVLERFPVGDAGRRLWRPVRPWDADRAARDRAYTPSNCVADAGACLREYADRSTQARTLLPWRALNYGPDDAEVLHFFPANRPGAPLHVFIHGGYWQELSEAESSFGAFADQHDDLVNTLTQLGAPVVDLVVLGRNHFDLPLGLGDPADLLGSAVLAQMELTVVTEMEWG